MSQQLSHTCNIVVPFYDVDPMHIVWHGNYLKYFEVVRCELLEKFDFGYRQMQVAGFMWPVIDVRVKYINSAEFGQTLKCRATIVEYAHRLKIEYLIECAKSGQRLTKGYTTQVAVEIESKELLLVSPQVLLDKLGITDAN